VNAEYGHEKLLISNQVVKHVIRVGTNPLGIISFDNNMTSMAKVVIEMTKNWVMKVNEEIKCEE
jgi:hypothetical protein